MAFSYGAADATLALPKGHGFYVPQRDIDQGLTVLGTNSISKNLAHKGTFATLHRPRVFWGLWERQNQMLLRETLLVAP